MNHMELKAPAKINWGLAVGPRRGDGYHELRSLMQTVSLYDRVSLSLSEKDGCNCDLALPEQTPNLALSAWLLLKRELGLRHCLHIDIKKRIPPAAGLGGGSADAAAVLRGANRLLNLGLSPQELSRLGLSLGSDVPFCLQGGLALVEGIGDRVSPLGLAPLQHLLLLNQGFSVSTAGVYAAFDRQDRHTPAPDLDRLAQALLSGEGRAIGQAQANMLAEPACLLHPPLRELLAVAANISVAANLSGSGGTVWALGLDEMRAQMTARALSLQFRYPLCQAVHTLDGAEPC